MSTQSKNCLECGIRFGGRADKKFCSDPCRIMYHNRMNSNETSYMRSVNHTLRKNRRILMELNPEGKNRVSLSKLKLRGFDFNYFTTTYKTKDGAQYFYCYEH